MPPAFKPLSDQPLVSIVMPVYNAGPYLKEAIDSVLNQSYTHFEFLIANDASTDNSLEILESYDDPRIQFFHNEENMGYLKTCNKLFSKVSGDLMTFQDSDDTCTPERIQIQVDEFLKDPELGLCGSFYFCLNTEGETYIPPVHRQQEDAAIKEAIYKGSQFCGATIMIRKEVLDDIGFYDEFFNRIGGEDYYWSMKIVEKYKSKNLPDFLYGYRLHDSAVKVGNVNRRKYYVEDIIRHLGKQRREKGTDALEDPALMPELEQKMDEWDKPLREDPTTILRRQSRDIINHKRYKDSFRYAFGAIRTAPGKMANWTNLLYVGYVITRRLVGI